ncbi:MAG: hypothetical protein AAB303_05665, partial [Chloroflexota bacterium]
FTLKQQFTLLCQRGATCVRGNLLVIPIVHENERFLLYAEPLYIQAENIAYPELKQVILADAKRVAMKGDLKSTLDALLGKGTETKKEDTTPSPTETTRQQQIDNVRQAIEDLQRAIDQLAQDLEEILKSTETGGQ